jgi:hypothetical protein
VRIEPDHGCTPTTKAQKRAVAETADTGFAATLASAVEASDDSDASSRPPEFSAATYRLFAAIDLARGDTAHAELHLGRVEDAREAGIPLHPAGVLNEIGRWDYTEDAAALPQTGSFDTASGQGSNTFIPYDATQDTGGASECDPAESAAAADAAAVDRLHAPRAASDDGTEQRALRAGIAALLEQSLES